MSACLGDVVVACHGDFAILSTTDFPYEAALVGLRGSLTPEQRWSDGSQLGVVS